jgi:adenylate cyclase
VSTGVVAAALLCSEERVEYTVVGDAVNLAQRLQDAARPAGSTIASAATVRGCDPTQWAFEERPPPMVKGRVNPVSAFAVRPIPADALSR